MADTKTGFYAIGLLITDDITELVHVSASGVYDTVKENMPEFDIRYVRNFTGLIKTVEIPVCEDPVKDPITTEYHGQDLVYIPVRNTPTLFHQAYHTVEELVDEIQETLNDIEIRLPADFPIIRNIVTISGITE